ncbi:MAG TPA: metallophosphoesterase family protein [Blastocatellia bacterium]|nr:metallophosphoesterase family protein [Blastocatellia bacterium]
MKIGVVSDTHGRFDSRLESLFEGVDLILHAGDIGKVDVIQALERIAPVLAVEGNNDSFGSYPVTRVEQLENRTFLIRHIFGEIHQLKAADHTLIRELKPDVIVFGHSHRAYREKLGGALLFNPGSAGPKRFSLPRTAGLLLLDDSGVEARILPLE